MATFLTLTINGLALAAIFFLVSAGLSLIFGLMGVLNFAHGSFVVWGAYVWLAVFNTTRNFWLALVAATLAGAAMGAITERVLIRPLYGRPQTQILVTLGLGLVLGQAVVVIWGESPQYFNAIPGLDGTLQHGDLSIATYRLFVIGAGRVILLAVWALLRLTRIGLIVRAGVENPTMTRALGINVHLVFLGVFSLGSALAALGGAVYAPYLSVTTPDMGQSMLLFAIIVVVLGGLGSYLGSALGALIIGLAQDYVPFYVSKLSMLPPNMASSAASLVSLALLVGILLWRPQGLLGLKLPGGAL
ncbi:MAG: branched-chain amino acid ABC transporter permease [Chloroflexota bacterium]